MNDVTLPQQCLDDCEKLVLAAITASSNGLTVREIREQLDIKGLSNRTIRSALSNLLARDSIESEEKGGSTIRVYFIDGKPPTGARLIPAHQLPRINLPFKASWCSSLGVAA